MAAVTYESPVVLTYPPEYICARTMAMDLGVTERTIRQWIRDGRLPTVRFPGRRVAVPIAAWERFKAHRAQII